ncbi:uncharacterized protein LOC135502447 [Lineus longissimus]|uniref:uncharacterized protein LOC135502447 n=1 Tax=Lineus longissimus TaxID=88925 RepID=UPI002B4E403B
MSSIGLALILCITINQSLLVIGIKTSPLDGAKIATWNINSVGRWGRDKGDSVLATFESVLNASSILGVQEATGIERYHNEHWGDRYQLCALEQEPEGTRSRTYRQFAVFVKADEYKVVGIWAEVLPLDEVYGIKCLLLPHDEANTRQNTRDHGILVYNVHLKAGKSKADAATRDLELSRLVKDVNDDRGDFGAQIVLGDFNYDQKANSKERWTELFSHIGINFQGVLEVNKKGYNSITEGQGFLYTTPGGGTYDGIFIPGHVAETYYSPDSKSSLEMFVPKNHKGVNVITDNQLSDHLPILGSLPLLGKIGSYNIRYFKLSSAAADTELAAVYASVINNMDVVAIQEVMNEKNIDRKEYLENMFSAHKWAVADQYACGYRAPYRIVGEAHLVDIGNGYRHGFLCKLTKPHGGRDMGVCLLNLHLLNNMAGKADVTRVIQHVMALMKKDPFCHQAYNIVLGDFNNQILQSSTYDKDWPSLQRLDCRHQVNTKWTYTAIHYKNRLDHILVAPPFDEITSDISGSCVVMSQLAGRPYRYKLESWREVSDHFPTFGTFDLDENVQRHPAEGG